jgi:predicted lipoprotein
MIEQRNAQLEKLYQVDQRGLPEKIKEKLTEILTTTISQKVDAEENLGSEKGRNY